MLGGFAELLEGREQSDEAWECLTNAGRGVAWVEVGARRQPRQEIALDDDGGSHTVVARLGLSGAGATA